MCVCVEQWGEQEKARSSGGKVLFLYSILSYWKLLQEACINFIIGNKSVKILIESYKIEYLVNFLTLNSKTMSTEVK